MPCNHTDCLGIDYVQALLREAGDPYRALTLKCVEEIKERSSTGCLPTREMRQMVFHHLCHDRLPRGTASATYLEDLVNLYALDTFQRRDKLSSRNIHAIYREQVTEAVAQAVLDPGTHDPAKCAGDGLRSFLWKAYRSRCREEAREGHTQDPDEIRCLALAREHLIALHGCEVLLYETAWRGLRDWQQWSATERTRFESCWPLIRMIVDADTSLMHGWHLRSRERPVQRTTAELALQLLTRSSRVRTSARRSPDADLSALDAEQVADDLLSMPNSAVMEEELRVKSAPEVRSKLTTCVKQVLAAAPDLVELAGAALDSRRELAQLLTAQLAFHQGAQSPLAARLLEKVHRRLKCVPMLFACVAAEDVPALALRPRRRADPAVRTSHLDSILDWERVDQIKCAARRVFEAEAVDPSADLDASAALCDPVAQRVVRALARDPLFALPSARELQATGAEPTQDLYIRNGLIAGRAAAGACASFSHRLRSARLPLNEDEREASAQVVIEEVKAAWKTRGGIPMGTLEVTLIGGWSDLVAAGALQEVALIVIEGHVEICCGDRVERLAAIHSRSASCFVCWAQEGGAAGLPALRVRTIGSKRAFLVLIGAAESPFEIDRNAKPHQLVPRGERSADWAKHPVYVRFDAAIGSRAMSWARSLPLIKDDAHEAEVGAGHFDVHDPIGQRPDGPRQLNMRVLHLHGRAPTDSLALVRHPGEELLIPLHGRVLCRYLDRSSMQHSNRTTIDEVRRQSPTTASAIVLTSGRVSNGFLDTAVVAIDSTEPHCLIADDYYEDAVCLHVLR